MLKKFAKNIFLFFFVFIFMVVLNANRESFSFSNSWLPFQETTKLERLNKVLYLIQEGYVDPEMINFSDMFESAMDNLSINIAKMSTQQIGKSKTIVMVGDKKKEFSSQIDTMFVLRSTLLDSIKFIHENVQPEFTISQLEEIAIEGVLNTLDPHSNFLSESLYHEMQIGTSGKFGGLGLVIGLRDSLLTVIAPIDGTPASRAGILPGDHISKIEDETTVGMALTEAVEKMRGNKGDPVTITIDRKGWDKPKDFHMVRDIIHVESVEATLLPNDIGYVKVKSFQEDTTKELKKSLAQITKKTPNGLKGLILDLRNNPGGLLDQAIEVSNLFLQEGTIVTTVGLRNKMRETQVAEPKNALPMFPMVVDVNEGSASASEIVAGAIQRNQRAIVLGQKTFGKGTVQTLYELPQKSALKLTVAKYLTPGDISIQSIGIGPDIQTVPVVIDAEQTTFFYSEDEHGEAELDRHFKNDQKPVHFEPEATVEYLFQRPKLDQETEKEYSFSKLPLEQKQKKLLEDFETNTSYSILMQTTGSSKKLLLEAAKKALGPISKNQNHLIELAMQKQGIDWSLPVSKTTKDTSCKEPQVSFEILPKTVQHPISSGDKIEIEAKMINPGQCTLYQAKATSKSESGFFDHREIFFGKLAPHQTVVRKIPLTIPKYQAAGSYQLTFKFDEIHHVIPQPQNVTLSVFPTKSPMYAFTYDIDDQVENQSGFLAPHIPERGEKFYFDLKIKNIGAAPSKETFVSIKQDGEKTLQLEKGREKLENVGINESRDVRFLLEVPQQFNEPSFNLVVTVSDMDYQSFTQKKINIRLFQAKVAESKGPPDVHYFEEPVITVSNLTQIMKTQSNSAVLEGMIKDDVSVQDMYVLVNGKKVTYHPFQNKSKSENFSLSVPLKKGKNEVIIVGRDDQDLVQTFPLNILSQ